MADDNRQVAKLAIIRLALTLGVLTFGGVTYALKLRGGGPPPATPDQVQQLMYVAYAVWGIGIAGIGGLRWFRHADVERGANPSVLVIGWALGEFVAIFGVVFWLLTGSPSLFGAGLVVFAAAFMLFPLRNR
jgi:hypothetical protein